MECVCIHKPEHINGAGRTREQDQTQEGTPLKLISTGRPSKGAEPFLGVRSHLLGEHHGNSQRGPQLSELSFSSARSKVAGQVFCYVASLNSLSHAHSSASPFLSLHDMVLALFTREAVRKLRSASVCGKMLPDNTGVCDSEGKRISSAWDKLGIYDQFRAILHFFHSIAWLQKNYENCRFDGFLFALESLHEDTCDWYKHKQPLHLQHHQTGMTFLIHSNLSLLFPNSNSKTFSFQTCVFTYFWLFLPVFQYCFCSHLYL